MTPLESLLLRRIGQAGPLTVAEFMAECLTHPEHGYYTCRDPFGTAGDFTTAPEISQMFGELVGLALAQAWLDQGAPSPFVLMELGPGRGTLMADMLRATRGVPGFHAGLRLRLVEVSPVLRARQAEAVGGFGPVWLDRPEDLADEGLPLFAIANEFFDALPVRQFLRVEEGWAERMVGRGPDGRLAFGLAPPAPLARLAHRIADTREGDLVEVNAAGEAVARGLGARIAATGGLALVIDYGGGASLGDTVQALRRQAPDPVLAHPGEADLTAHVDFDALARAAGDGGAAVAAMTPQGPWLERLGIAARAEVLARRLSGPALDSHMAALRRLTHPDEMGDLFKVMAFLPPGAPAPPGFAP